MCIALEKAIQAYLHLDPQTRQRITKLADKVIEIKLTDWQIVFYLMINNEDIKVQSTCQGPIDCAISGSSFSLLRAGLRPRDAGFDQSITIAGDVELGQQVQQILAHAKVDWEEYTSHFTGDVVAHGLGRFVQTFKQWWQNSQQRTQSHITEFLQEEIRCGPPREEVEDFFADVRVLANDVERLCERQKLKKA